MDFNCSLDVMDTEYVNAIPLSRGRTLGVPALCPLVIVIRLPARLEPRHLLTNGQSNTFKREIGLQKKPK